jgi:hypothetical protein
MNLDMDMLNKKSLYHLHIPKTAGITLNVFLKKSIAPDLIANNISCNVDGHHGWKLVNKETYILTSLREPIKRLVSHFCFMNSLNNIDSLSKTPQDFLLWFENNKEVLSNYQSKNLFYNDSDIYTPEFLRGCSPELSLKTFSQTHVKNNISKINILLRTEDINSKKIIKVGNKILKDFNINHFNTFNISKEHYNSNTVSRLLFSKLSKSDISYLESNNLLDLDIYNTDLYF